MENNKEIEVEMVDEVINVPILGDAKLPYEISYIDELVIKFANVPDLVAEDGETEDYKAVKANGILLSKVIKAIEDQRLVLTSPALKYQKETKAKFDLEKKKLEPIRDMFKIQRAKVDGYLENKRIEEELAEKTRVDNIMALINRYKSYPMECIGKSSKVIQEVIDLVEAPTLGTTEEYFDEAVVVYDSSMAQMKNMFENQVLVENAQKVQDELNAKADAEEAERQEKRDAEQKKFEYEREEFEKQKRDFEAQQQAIQEEKNREQAEREADELQKKQETEKTEKRKQDKINLEEAKADTHNKIIEFDGEDEFSYDEFIEAVINNEIPNIKWVQDNE